MSVSTALLRRFEDLSREDVDYAGGKGANLGEMTGAGLPIPPGFVVAPPPTPTFARSAACASGWPSGSRASTSTTPRRSPRPPPISGRWSRPSRFPARLRRRSGADMRSWAGTRTRSRWQSVPRRPPRTPEAASFAGMNETLLNVQGADAVVDAVRRCWSSLFGGRTVFYRAKRGFGQADMDIAVVVQRQVLSTRAGVMFTIDPASGDHGSPGDRGLLRARRGGGLGQRVSRPLRGREGVAGDPGARREAQGTRDRAAAGRGDTSLASSAARRQWRPCCRDDEVRELASSGSADRGPLRETSGHRVVPSTPTAAPGCCSRVRSPPAARSRRSGRCATGEVLVRGLGAAPGAGQRSGAGDQGARRGRSAQRRGGPRHPHDGARLGAADAAGGGDRHRLRRDDLPRGDRLPRAWDPVRGRQRPRRPRSSATARS